MPKSKKKTVNVLSFDGGGSRGLMEVLLLQDTFLILSFMIRNPLEITELIKKNPSFKLPSSREAIRALMDKVTDPIHPTEVFDYIVGKCQVIFKVSMDNTVRPC